MSVKEAIRKMVKEGGFDATMDRGTVISVDKTACTCVVQLVSNDAELQDVKLKTIINEGDATQLGFVLYPAVNSFVTVGRIDDDNTDLILIDITIIESIGLDTATALKLLIDASGNFNLNANLITFNNGKNGGIPMLNPLAAILLKQQQTINQLISAFTTHIHPVAGASTGPTVTLAPATITPLVKTSDIENKSIVQ
jgi:hypothetical protein